MQGRSQTISFRLTNAECETLDRLCASLNIGRGDLVRSFAKRCLAEQREGLIDRMDRLEGEVKSLRKDHARCVALLLQRLGKLPVEEARDAVRGELLR